MKKMISLAIIFISFMFCTNVYAINCNECVVKNDKCMKDETECVECKIKDSVCVERYNNYKTDTPIVCGNADIPSFLPSLVSTIYKLLQVLVPILLIIFGMIDLLKGITAQKEEEVKKGQQMFIKRLISGALVFFVFALVKLVISLTADSGNVIIECVECLISNIC